MTIRVCGKCGARNRVDERVTVVGRRPVCGRCGAALSGEDEAAAPASAGPVSAAEAAKTRDVTDATFAGEVIARSARVPVLLDCWAPWCGPCRTVAPILDQLAAESGGLYLVAKLNVDENPRTAAQLEVRSIPMLFVFKNGKPVERIVGAQPKNVIAARLSAHL